MHIIQDGGINCGNMEENIVAIIHIYGDKAILYYFVFTRNMNLTSEKYILA